MTGQTSIHMMMADALDMSVPVVKAGDTESRLSQLFDSHHRRLYGLARRLSPSAEDARDLVQDTYLRAARKLRSVPFGGSNEEAWLVRVLVNLCRDQWRQTTVRQRHAHYLRNAGRAVPSGEAAAIAKATVWQALEALSPRRRAVVVMCELEGLSISSVARTFGLA